MKYLVRVKPFDWTLPCLNTCYWSKASITSSTNSLLKVVVVNVKQDIEVVYNYQRNIKIESMENYYFYHSQKKNIEILWKKKRVCAI